MPWPLINWFYDVTLQIRNISCALPQDLQAANVDLGLTAAMYTQASFPLIMWSQGVI